MDHDRLFKDLLTTFFTEFLELFFPEMAAGIDRDQIEFLDKEVFPDLNSGDRNEVDLLAKVRLQNQEAFILIHVENQSTHQNNFPKRMFNYFSVLHRKFDLPVYPIAIFSYDRPTTPPIDAYSIELFGAKILQFQFQPIQLNRLRWRDFLSRPNPVAIALMTKMSVAPADRPRVKLECLRMMLTLKLKPARAELIAGFMKSYLSLTAAEKVVYTQEIEKIDPDEREIVMNYVNEWEEQGYLNLLLRMLQRRFGSLSTDLLETLHALSSEQLLELSDALLDFKQLSDLNAWLDSVPHA